jgi:peroxiredoxin
VRYAVSVRRNLALSILLLALVAAAQKQEVVWSKQEKPIAEQLKNIRSLADDVRAVTTRDLALKIRALPVTPNQLRLAMGLASRATEGDFGRGTLQEVTTTLADAIRESAPKSGMPYRELASLVRYEHMNAAVDSPQFAAAMAKLEAEDQMRQDANFTLNDLNGKPWTLRDLRGKVVLLNFWATWCPPCRKEMPDLESLYQRFAPQGFVILGISDEEAPVVQKFIVQQGITYPILLDPGRKLNKRFQIEGIPKTFVYDRDGEIVAQSIDMRTRGQFLEMLGRAGLK